MQALVFANIQVVRVACSFCCVDGLHKHLWFLSLHLCNECLSHKKEKKKKEKQVIREWNPPMRKSTSVVKDRACFAVR